MTDHKVEYISLGTGCFWCTEALFSRLKGVLHTSIGYGGGVYPDPDYMSISNNPGGHAEITRLEYNVELTSLETILEFFFSIHNPSKKYIVNNNKGSLYRSVILYDNEDQKNRINQFILTFQKSYKHHIKTDILLFKNFKKVDEKYQNYYASNPDKPFCKNVITPKLVKFFGK